ncbi:MAG: hypothetical protein IIT45_06865 [Treponema sp.]|nr:hypothetical protein [Treponema sp.]
MSLKISESATKASRPIKSVATIAFNHQGIRWKNLCLISRTLTFPVCPFTARQTSPDEI